ncbi:MAG: acyl-CoA desaturase [Planctomycetota bacterium]
MPWQRSFFWSAPNEWPTLWWVIGIHAAAITALVLQACGVLPLPPWPVLVLALVLLTLGGLGTTVAYHRVLAHRAAKLNPLVEQFLIACAMLNGSGNPRTWVATHRHHHRFSDTENDISSPNQGMWWSHLRWLWQAPAVNLDAYAPDLDEARYRVWGKIQVLMLAVSAFGGLAWLIVADWQTAIAAAAWIGPIRLVWALHAQCTVNSVCHLGAKEEHGTGKNVTWLAPLHLFQGENWHANHHREPNSARLGMRWWQIDIGWACLRSLAVVRLASRVRSIPS